MKKSELFSCFLVSVWSESYHSPRKAGCEGSLSLSWKASDLWQDILLGGQTESLVCIVVSDLLFSVIKQTSGGFWLRFIFQKIHVCLGNLHFVFGR